LWIILHQKLWFFTEIVGDSGFNVPTLRAIKIVTPTNVLIPPCSHSRSGEFLASPYLEEQTKSIGSTISWEKSAAFCGNSPKADCGNRWTWPKTWPKSSLDLLLRGDSLFLGLGHDLRNDLGAFLARLKRFDANVL
jgi:hypothetical protein